MKIQNTTDTNKRIRLTALDSAMSNIDDSTGAVAKVGREVLLCLAPKGAEEFLTSYFLPDIHDVPGVVDQGGYINVSLNDGPMRTLSFPAGALPPVPGMSTNFMALMAALQSDSTIGIDLVKHFHMVGVTEQPPTESTPENPVGFIGVPKEAAVFDQPIKFTFFNVQGEGVNLYSHLGFTGDSFSLHSWGLADNNLGPVGNFFEHYYYAGGDAVVLRSQQSYRVDTVDANGLQQEAFGGQLTGNRGIAISPDDLFLLNYSDETETQEAFTILRKETADIGPFDIDVVVDHNGEVPVGAGTVHWSADSQLFVVCSWTANPNKYFIYKRQADNSFLQVFKMKRETSNCMSFSPNGAQLVLAEMNYGGELFHTVPHVFDVNANGELDTTPYELVGEFLPKGDKSSSSQVSSEIIWLSDTVAIMSRTLGLSAITIDPVAKTVTGKNLVSPGYEFNASLRSLMLLDNNTKLGYVSWDGEDDMLAVVNFNAAELTVDLASIKFSEYNPNSGDEGNTKVHPRNDKLISVNSGERTSTLDWYLVNADNTVTKVAAPANA